MDEAKKPTVHVLVRRGDPAPTWREKADALAERLRTAKQDDVDPQPLSMNQCLQAAQMIDSWPDMLAVLQQVEWSATETDDENNDCEACLWCGNPRPDGMTADPHGGHTNDCKLFIAIAKATGTPTP